MEDFLSIWHYFPRVWYKFRDWPLAVQRFEREAVHWGGQAQASSRLTQWSVAAQLEAADLKDNLCRCSLKSEVYWPECQEERLKDIFCLESQKAHIFPSPYHHHSLVLSLGWRSCLLLADEISRVHGASLHLSMLLHTLSNWELAETEWIVRNK